MSDTAGSPPVADREPTVWEASGGNRDDDYAWMRYDADRLLPYLDAERAFYDAAVAHTADAQAMVYDEMAGRVAPDDDSVGWRHGDFVYNLRQREGQQYPQFRRRPTTERGNAVDSAVVLDLNVLAQDSAYLALGVREVSPNGKLLAYSVDTDGDEVYELRVRDIETGEDLPDRVARSYYGCAWSADSTTLVYVVHDEAYRPYRVMRHQLGTPETDDTLAYEEPDERFSLDLKASRSGELIIITANSTTSTETRLLKTADVQQLPTVVAPRRPGVEYSVEHVPSDVIDGGWLYVITNDDAVEFKLMRAPVKSGAVPWIEVVAENPVERLVCADAFDGHLVLTFRRDADQLLRVLDLETGEAAEHDAAIPAGTIWLASRVDRGEPVHDAFDSNAITVMIESLIEPPSWWTIDLASGAREHVKTTATPTYDPTDYISSRIMIEADDGTPIPVTIAYRKDVPRDGTAPCLLYGYGAYEICIEPYFSLAFPSLLDRGVVYAIAHIRGGGEGGRNWWLQGRMHYKRNTFNDFIAAAGGLAAQGWIDGDRVVSRGGSAGGLLVGAALSISPQTFRAVVAEVPFVDCVTTMLDATMPLTAGEWEEWGDPREAEDFRYMASYSPYDNVPLGARPDLLATGSVHDSRVGVHEPAKWVAKLRATQTDDSVVLFRAETGSGAHTGPSGRYDKLRYQAEIAAYILDKLDSNGVKPSAISD